MTITERIEEITLDEKQKRQVVELMSIAFVQGMQFHMATGMLPSTPERALIMLKAFEKTCSETDYVTISFPGEV